MDRTDIQNLDRIRRLNLINSVTGIKPANLIGTISKDSVPNLAIFSSIVHIGSNPPLIGFFLRPSGETRRDTYQNLLDTSICTVNSVHTSFTEQAHYTSAKFEAAESEFEQVGLTPEFIGECPAPFVQESRLKYSLKIRQTIPIELNGTRLIIGEIEQLIVDNKAVSDTGYIDLGQLSIAGISGLNSYYETSCIANYPYARTSQLPDFQEKTNATGIAEPPLSSPQANDQRKLS